MNTVCLLGIPRRACNSNALATRFLAQAVKHGAPVHSYALADHTYDRCRNLFRCKTDLDHCGQVDDLTSVLAKIAEAQVLVLATPIYFTSVTGQLKLAINRLFSFLTPDYPTAEITSRLSPGRHLVLLQAQGEGEDRYADLTESFSAGFHTLGFAHHHLVRASAVRNPGDIGLQAPILDKCDAAAAAIYAGR